MIQQDKNKQAVLLSIQPRWCRMILSGQKTIEVRKTKPSLETPFQCYIYCTLSGSKEFFQTDLHGDVALWNREKWYERKGMVIGEFTCGRIYDYTAFWDFGSDISDDEMLMRSCLTTEEIKQYEKPKIKGNSMYCGVHAWSIENLAVYEQPKALKELGLLRAPQSWCYCKELSA